MLNIFRNALGATLIVMGLWTAVEAFGLMRAELHIIEPRREIPAGLENGALFEIPVEFQTKLGLLLGMISIGLGSLVMFVRFGR